MALTKIIESMKLVSCSEDTSLREVAELMKAQDVGAVLVLDEDRKPVGIVSDRDLVLRGICDELDCDASPVSDVMTASVKTVTKDGGIFDVISLMKAEGIRRVPVVDDHNRAIALVSSGDLYKLLAEEFTALTDGVAPAQAKIEVENAA